MKNFWEGLMKWKFAAALMFSGSVILCTIILLFAGKNAIPISVVVSLFIVSSVGTFLQFLAFSGYIIKKARYTIRMIIFALPFLALLAANAYFFSWFPAMHWISFFIIFLLVFTVMTAGFEIYYHAMGKKYDGLLGQYRKQRELQDK